MIYNITEPYKYIDIVYHQLILVRMININSSHKCGVKIDISRHINSTPNIPTIKDDATELYIPITKYIETYLKIVGISLIGIYFYKKLL